MKNLVVIVVLVLLCMSASAAMANWSDDFSGYTPAGGLTAPWESIYGDMKVVTNGYSGNGISITEAVSNWGRAFRQTGDVNTNMISARFMFQASDIVGGINFGLQSDTTAAYYGLTGDFIQLQTYASKIYFYSNPAGVVSNGNMDITAGEWWDMKLEKVGTNWVGSAKLSSSGTWNIIGTASGTAIPSTFVPNYVGVTYWQNTTIDDINVSSVPEPGSLLALGTGLIGIAGFAIRRRK